MSRFVSLAVAVVLLSAAAPARAGEPAAKRSSSSPPSSVAAKAGAETSPGGAKPAAEEPSAETRKQATASYMAGMEAFDGGEIERAIKLFRESYELMTSPNSRFMLARALARRGDNAEAWAELEATAEEAEALGDKYADTAASARAKLEEIRPRVALVTITLKPSPKGTRVLLGENELPAARLGRAIAVLPGDTQVTVVTPGGKQYPETVNLPAGTEAKLSVGAPEEPAADEAQEATAYIAQAEHHPHHFQAEVRGTAETVGAPNGTPRGGGVGARVGYQVLPTGLISSANDGLALAVAGDYIATSPDSHALLSLTVEWSFWLTPELSLGVDPGVGMSVGAGSGLHAVVHGTARIRVWSGLHLVGRVGIPDATGGLAFLW